MKSVDFDVGQEAKALLVLALLTAFLIWLLVIASPGMPDISPPSGDGIQQVELDGTSV